MKFKNIFILAAMVLSVYSATSQTLELRHDHSNILVSDLNVSSQFYMDILKLQELETPWGK